VHYNCQFDEILQLTKSSGKKMSFEVAFETVKSSSGSEFHAAGPAWEKARSQLRPHPRLNRNTARD